MVVKSNFHSKENFLISHCIFCLKVQHGFLEQIWREIRFSFSAYTSMIQLFLSLRFPLVVSTSCNQQTISTCTIAMLLTPLSDILGFVASNIVMTY